MAEDSAIPHMPEQKLASSGRMPRRVLGAPLIYALLLVIALAVFHSSKNASFELLGLPLPRAVPWFGMLGGLVIGLQGIFHYNGRWDPNYELWYWFSGVVGAAYGLVGCLFLLVVAKSAVSGSVDSNGAVFALGAFSLGYGQRHFHAMMDQVFKTLFRDAGEAEKPGAGRKAQDMEDPESK